MDKRTKREPILRRAKRDPYSDFIHTLQIGVPVAVILFLILPFIFRHI
jgi:hypothetical protein